MENAESYAFPCGIYELQNEIGTVLDMEEECPGVFYVSSVDPIEGYSREQYIIDRAAPFISETAKRYGHPLKGHPELNHVIIEKEGDGDKVIMYEILRYKKQHDLPIAEDEDILATAVFGMEDYPEYFGHYPAPIMTPRGKTARYQEIINGILLLETEAAERLIAICYPIWSGDLSEYARRCGEQTEYDKQRGINHTFGYLFFREDSGSVAIFELWNHHTKLKECGRIDGQKLMNALWQHHPHYVIQHNDRETRGENDSVGLFFRELGMNDVELKSNPDNLISMSLDMDTHYLKW